MHAGGSEIGSQRRSEAPRAGATVVDATVVEDSVESRASNDSQLVIVGAGIEWGQTTLAAEKAMQLADRVLFAVADPLTARWIRDLNPAAQSLVYPRDGRPRQGIYAAMVEQILEALSESRRVCAVFYGCPAVLVQPAHDAIRSARARGHVARMLPGVSFLDCLYADLEIDPGAAGCSIYEAGQFLARGARPDTRAHLVLCQVGMIGNRAAFDPTNQERLRSALGTLGERLQQSYPAQHRVVVYEAARHPFEAPRAEWRSLEGIAGARITGISTLYVPPVARAARSEGHILPRAAAHHTGDAAGRVPSKPDQEDAWTMTS